jgi:hypothetical protein
MKGNVDRFAKRGKKRSKVRKDNNIEGGKATPAKHHI